MAFINIALKTIYYTVNSFGFKMAFSRAGISSISWTSYFEKNEFTLGVFVDLFKALDTVEH